MPLYLTDAEKDLLEGLEDRYRQVADKVQKVVDGYDTCLFVWGSGGIGKSHVIEERLRRERDKKKIQYTRLNTSLTAIGLMLAMRNAPRNIFLVEDCETLFKDDKFVNLMRSATFSLNKDRPQLRYITRLSGIEESNEAFDFWGGLIITANTDLPSGPAWSAVKGRINSCYFSVTQAEMIAKAKNICLFGYKYGNQILNPDECWEVAEFILENLKSLHRPLDFRHFEAGFKDYLSGKDAQLDFDWKTHLFGRIKESTVPRKESRRDRTARKIAIAQEIKAKVNSDKSEAERLWKEQTKSDSKPDGEDVRTYYLMLERAETLEAQSMPLFPEDSDALAESDLVGQVAIAESFDDDGAEPETWEQFAKSHALSEDHAATLSPLANAMTNPESTET